MPQDNEKLARHLYAATAEPLRKARAGEDIDRAPELVELWDPDCVVVEVAEYPDASTHLGIEGIRSWLVSWLDAYEEISIEPQEFIPAGDSVVVATRQRFRSRVGIELEQQITQVLRFRNGKLIYAPGYRERSRALEAVGLDR